MASENQFFRSRLSGIKQHRVEVTSATHEDLTSGMWAELSVDEVRRIWNHLTFEESAMNITSAGNASNWDNILLTTELLRPNKSDSLAFLELGAAPPDRYARISVKRNSLQVPRIEDYMVGPLKTNATLGVQSLSYLYNSGRSWTTNPTPDIDLLLSWFDEVAEDVSDIVQALLGDSSISFRQLGANAFEASSNDAIECEKGRQVRWMTFFEKSTASTLLPQPLYFQVDTTGRDPSKWTVVKWWYNGVVYNDTDDLRAAISRPSFERLPPNLDGLWTTLDPSLSLKTRDGSMAVGSSLMQYSSKLSINRSSGLVSWLGFDFTIAFSQTTGVSLFNIRLDGERIIYELGLQEAMAHYAGDDPIQSGTAFLDTLFGFGAHLSPLIPGFDCPDYASFLSTAYHRMERSYTRQGTICVFESPTDYPLQRHSRKDKTVAFVNSVLIVRSIAVIGNYDYLLDYIFFLDGSVEVKVRASGYIQGAYSNSQSDYGYRVHDQFSSSIHDHVLNFKADLDISGRTNNLSVINIEAADIEYPWSDGIPRHTMVLNRTQIISEDESALNWPPNGASLYVITGETNKYGESRAYRVMPGTGVGTPSHLIPKNSSNLRKAAFWATYDLFVTKQKDTECFSARPANILNPDDPLVAFDRFLDGESLVDEDL